MASETEATLLVCSEKPQQLMGEIAGLQSIGGYTLQDNGIEIIRDIYFDTTDLLLQKQKLAVRLRQINSAFKLTFKGPSRDVGKSSVKRTEIEEPWSEKALQNVMNELESRNIKLKQHESGDANQFDYEHDPLVVLKRLGLEIIQERVTERHAKNVVVAEDGRALAELALDSVTYHFGQRDIRVFEIEIEVKDGKSFTVPDDISEKLVSLFSPFLKKWKYSKVVTGMAIKELLNNKAFEGLFVSSQPNNILTTMDCDKIENHLRNPN